MVDIIVIFNSAYFDENFALVTDRWKLSLTYVKGWLFIDLIAILPFDLFVPSNGEAANLVRFARIGRVTKILKLLKLMRLMKLQKTSKFSLLTYLQDVFEIGKDFKWMVTFMVYFMMVTHVVACIWIKIFNIIP